MFCAPRAPWRSRCRRPQHRRFGRGSSSNRRALPAIWRVIQYSNVKCEGGTPLSAHDVMRRRKYDVVDDDINNPIGQQHP